MRYRAKFIVQYPESKHLSKESLAYATRSDDFFAVVMEVIRVLQSIPSDCLVRGLEIYPVDDNDRPLDYST